MAHPRLSVASAGPIGGTSGDAGVEYRRAAAAYAVVHALVGEALTGSGFALITESFVYSRQDTEAIVATIAGLVARYPTGSIQL